MFNKLLSALRGPKSRTPAVSGGGRPARRRRLVFEALEARAMLSSSPWNLGILLLDPSGSGALSRSGKGSVLVSNGDIVIDSSSSTAGMIVGGGSVSAANIAVTGNLQAAGPGKFVGTVDEGSAALADPLANLIQPAAPAASFNNTVVRSKTVTLAPGTYVNGIRVYGNSNVTLLPGLYYLQSGGLIVNGSSKLTGTGVSIFNAPANSSGSIDIDTTGSVRLSAPTSGAYQGIVIFQNRTSSAPLDFDGGSLNLAGEVYAADATVKFSSNNNAQISGNGGTIPGALIARDLVAGGNGSLNVAANSGGATGDLSTTLIDSVGGSSINAATGTLSAGSSLLYTITVANFGPAAVTGAILTDSFPAAVASDTYTITASGGAADVTHAGSGSGNLAEIIDLPAGGSITYLVSAVSNASATGSMADTATVASPADFTDTNPTNNSASDTDVLMPTVKLSIAQTDSDGGSSITSTPGEASPGTAITYSVTASNAGPSDAVGVTVADSLAAALDDWSVSGSDGFSANGSAGGNFSDSGVSVAAGGSVKYTISGIIDPAAAGSIENTATLTPGGAPSLGASSALTATDMDNVVPGVDLTIVLSDSVGGAPSDWTSAVVVPGVPLTYTLTVSNIAGETAVGALISDPLGTNGDVDGDSIIAVGSGGASGFTASGSGSIADTVDLPPGATIIYDITAFVAPGAVGTLTNTASVAPGPQQININPAAVNGVTSATDAEVLQPRIDLELNKTDSGGGLGAAALDVLDSLTGCFGPAPGATPYTALVASGSTLYGTTMGGGAFGEGELFSVQADGTQFTVLHSFDCTDGTNPLGGLVLSGDTLIGTAYLGGPDEGGEIFSYNLGSGAFTIVHAFDGLDGDGPDGNLTLSSDGSTVYGTTFCGGAKDDGTLYSFNLNSETLTVLHAFDYTDGGWLEAGVTLSGSMLYGTTYAGGPNSDGEIFSYDLSNKAFAVLHTFAGPDGEFPQASVTLAGSTLYGTTSYGGADCDGEIFSYDLGTQTFAIVHSFDNTDGNCPTAGLTLAGATLFGTTEWGNANCDGEVFSINTDGSGFNVLEAFNGINGAGPAAGLTLAGSTLYGTTTAGGCDCAGEVFSLTLGHALPGSSITYTLTVSNTGPSDAVGVSVADLLGSNPELSGDTFTAITAGGASGFTAEGSGSINDTVNLAAGASVTYTITADISASAAGTLVNSATITWPADEFNGNPLGYFGTITVTDADLL